MASIWDEAFEARVADEAGLRVTATYHASGASPRTLIGVGNERVPQGLTDDQLGRKENREFVLELPHSDANGPVNVVIDGKGFFEILGERWLIRSKQRGRGSWVIVLDIVDEQSIRKVQRSTR